jgi:transcriptional regulator with XRE-family HTH domain
MSTTHPHPLRDWRNKAGAFAERDGEPINQEKFAEQVGVVASQISQIESGDRRPSLVLAVRISEKTGIPVSDLAAYAKGAAA